MPTPPPPEEHRIKPGEVRNPQGRNQYSTRRAAEAIFDRLVTETAEDRGDRTVAEGMCAADELAERESNLAARPAGHDH